MSLGNSGATKSFLDQVKADAERITRKRIQDAEEERQYKEQQKAELLEKAEKEEKKASK